MTDFDRTDPARLARPSGPPSGKPPLRVDFAALSHRGQRSSNEDNYLVARWSRSMELLATSVTSDAIPSSFEESGHAFIVADGMGGRAAGEVASRLAMETVVAIALERGKWALRLDDHEARASMERIAGFIQEVDRVIGERAETDRALKGMGTTLTAAVAAGPDLLLFHVGDSRAYRLRDGRLVRLTHDQTIVQDLTDAGLITPEQASRHRLRHVLSQAVGRRNGKVAVAADWRTLAPGDVLLLCTDGLTEHVDDPTIGQALGASSSSSSCCQALVDLALAGGGSDNVTVVVARFTAA